jgi:hypothetical protein
VSEANPTLQQQFLQKSTPIPNWYFDEILNDTDVTDAVNRTFLFLFRKTVGWNNYSEEKSLTQIMEGCGISRHTAIHAIAVLCDCWGLWRKTRGRKGEHSSIYEVAGIRDAEWFRERSMMTMYIYDTVCPTHDQLRNLPPTEQLYGGVKSLMDSDRTPKEKDRLIATFVLQHLQYGKQERAEKEAEKREKIARRRAKAASAVVALPSEMVAPMVVQ